MTTEMNKDMNDAIRELTIDELEVVSGGGGRIVLHNVFNDLFFNPNIRVVEKD
jgi:hypothetical protein